MSIEEIIPIVISFIALTLSAYSFRKSNTIANANIELSIYNMIRNSKSSLYEISKQLMLLEKDYNKRNEHAEKLYKSLVEDLVTSYEEACTKYLDNKVDRIRFEKNFKSDIRNIIEDNEISEIVGLNKPSAHREYGAILKVYQKWHSKEI